MNMIIQYQIYPYGQVWDMSKNKKDENKEDYVSIYTLTKPFEEVPLSSLEGYFVVFSDKSLDNDSNTENFSSFVPQFHVKRENMGDLERKFNGRFILFEDRENE